MHAFRIAAKFNVHQSLPSHSEIIAGLIAIFSSFDISLRQIFFLWENMVKLLSGAGL